MPNSSFQMQTGFLPLGKKWELVLKGDQTVLAKLGWQKQTRRESEAKGVQRPSLNSLSASEDSPTLFPAAALVTLRQNLTFLCFPSH